MPDLATWKGYAKQHNGNLVVWINQSDAPNLKAANSEGVCAAITRDWITSFRKYTSDRAKFVNSFRQYDDSGTLLGYAIPDPYLARQNEMRQEFAAFKTRRRDMIKKTVAYKKQFPGDKDFLPALLETLRLLERVQAGGADCIKYTPSDKMSDIVIELSLRTTSGMSTLSMRKATGGGHIVGFEFRPDVSTSSFAELNQFLDANFGLFVFGNSIDMMDFFEQKVWNTYYKPKYTKFGLAEYDTGLGGFGLSPAEKKQKEQEALDKEIAEMEAEFERELGKDWWKPPPDLGGKGASKNAT